MATDSPSHTAPEDTSPRWWRLLRRVLHGIGGVVTLIATLALVALLLLQTTWGAETAARFIARQANPFTNATIRIGGVSGNWLQTLELRNVDLVPTGDSANTDRFAHLDTLRVRYRLWPLLRNTLHMRDVELVGPSASIHQQPDSTWMLPALAPSPAEPDTTPSTFAVRIDRIRLTRGAMTARFYSPQGDSTLRVQDFHVGARDLEYSSPLTGRIDTLSMDALLPGIETPLHLQAAASLTAERFTLDGLRLSSPHSRVQGKGTLRLPQTPTDVLDDVDFTLTAAPLAFRDVAPFVPGVALAPNEQLHLDVQARGSGHLLQLRTDARFSTGGSITIDATATPSLPADVETTLPEPLRYRIDAQARQLSTEGLIASTSPTPTRVNADVQVDLEGPALNRLSGTVAARLFDTQVVGHATRSTQLQLSFSNGRASIDGEGDFAGATFAASGTIAPFAERPSYDLQTQLSDLNIGAFAEESGQESALNTELHLVGEGFSSDSARLTARLNVLPSTINQQRIDSGLLTFRLARDTLRYDTRVAFPEGRFAAAGQALLSSPLQYSVERGQFESVNVAALIGDSTASALNGSFTLQGRELTPATMQLQTDLQLRDSYYGGYVLNTATTRTTLRQGQFDLDLRADLQGGQFEFAATAQPFAELLTLRTTRGRFQNVDIGPLLQDSTQSSNLDGTFSFNGRGLPLDSLGVWNARVILDSSRVNQQPLQAARLDATLQQSRVDFALQLDVPAGRTRLAGRARPFDAVPTYALTDGTLDGLDLGALAGIPSARTTLNGALTLRGRGFDPATLSLDARLNLSESMLNKERLERGTLQVRLDSGEGSVDGQFELSQGRMTLQASARAPNDRPTYRIRGRLDDVNAAALAGIDSLETHVSLGVEFEGEGIDPATLRLDGRITSQQTRYASLRLDTLDANVQMTDGLLRIDTLLARSNVATAHGGGQIALYDPNDRYESNFFVEARTTNVAPLRSLLGMKQLSLDEGRFEGRVYGNPGSVRFDATTTLTNLAYDDIRLADLETQVAGARGDTTALSILEIHGSIGFFSYASFSVEDTRFNARYDDDTVDFTTSLTIDRERNARMEGLIDLRPGQEKLTLQTLDMKLGADRWTLLQDASVAYGDAYRISNLLLYSGQQQLAADGVVDFDGTQSLIVTMERIEVASFADLMGFEGLGGRLSGTLEMSGAAQSPQMTGTLNLDVRSSDKEVGQLRLGVRYDSLRADLDALLTHVDGSTLAMRGQVPADLRLAAPDESTRVMDDPVNLTLAAKAFSIGWIDPFIDPTLAQNISGQFDADATIGGTLDTPALSGSGTLRSGRLELPTLHTEYDRINADLDFTGEQVRIRQASARSSGSGRLRAQGTINLTDLTLGAYDLSVNTSDFLAIDTREYRARVNSDLMVSGTTQRPVVNGTVQVQSADIYFVTGSESEAELMTVQLSPEDQQTIERRFGIRLTEADTTTFDAYQAMAMDLNIQFERDTWLRSRSNPKMSIQFIGNLDAQKEPFQDVQVFGNIEVIPERSRVVQFGKEFQIEEGELIFNGPATEPVMDIRAVYRIRARGSQESEAEIILSITGRPEELNLTLSSNPPMDTNNILSYLAVGRPADRLRGMQNGADASDQSLAERIALGQAAGIIENLAASKLGLDVVRIEPMPDGSIFLTAGQYLSPRFYAAVQQSITDQPGEAVTSNVPDITLEYELTRWLLMRALYRNPDLRLNLFWEYAY